MAKSTVFRGKPKHASCPQSLRSRRSCLASRPSGCRRCRRRRRLQSVDGDTVGHQGQIYRLVGFDTPERGDKPDGRRSASKTGSLFGLARSFARCSGASHWPALQVYSNRRTVLDTFVADNRNLLRHQSLGVHRGESQIINRLGSRNVIDVQRVGGCGQIDSERCADIPKFDLLCRAKQWFIGCWLYPLGDQRNG